MPDEDQPQQPTPPEPVPVPDAPVAETSIIEAPAPSEPAPIETPVQAEPPVEVVMPTNDLPVSPVPVQVEESSPAEVTPVLVTQSPSVPVQTIPTPVAPISNAVPTQIVPAPDHSSSAYLRSLVPLSKAERNRRRQAHIERLIKHAAAKGHVTRRDAQLLLEVSGATADRYLRELASEGRIVKESGGRYTKYRFVG